MRRFTDRHEALPADVAAVAKSRRQQRTPLRELGGCPARS